MPACVLPVAAADALKWAAGELGDKDLILRSPLKPEAIFIVWLGSLSDWRACLRKMIGYRQRGAVMMIMRTGNAAVASHFESHGGIATLHEHTTPPATRYLGTPDKMDAYFSRFGCGPKGQAQYSAASSGVAISR